MRTVFSWSTEVEIHLAVGIEAVAVKLELFLIHGYYTIFTYQGGNSAAKEACEGASYYTS